jgi:hypothetical protein
MAYMLNKDSVELATPIPLVGLIYNFYMATVEMSICDRNSMFFKVYLLYITFPHFILHICLLLEVGFL